MGTEVGLPVVLMTSRHIEKEDKMEGKAKFVSPQIQDNPDGWGPCCVPTAFKDIPYQPFSKGDRIGKVNLTNYVIIWFFSRCSSIAHGHVGLTGISDKLFFFWKLKT